MSKSGRAERRRLEMRERVYQAACILFVEHGYSATTMADIAESADVARGTAFNHFPAKADLALEWTRRRRARAAAAARALPGAASAEEQIRAYFHELASITNAEPALAKEMMLGWVMANGPITDASFLAQDVVPMVIDGVDRGEFSVELDVNLASELLRDAYLGTFFRWMNGEHEPGAFGAELEAVISLVVRALEASHS